MTTRHPFRHQASEVKGTSTHSDIGQPLGLVGRGLQAGGEAAAQLVPRVQRDVGAAGRLAELGSITPDSHAEER